METILFTDLQAGIFISEHMGLFFAAIIGSLIALVAFGEKVPVHKGQVVYPSKDGYSNLAELNGDKTVPAAPVTGKVTYEYRPLHRPKKFFW